MFYVQIYLNFFSSFRMIFTLQIRIQIFMDAAADPESGSSVQCLRIHNTLIIASVVFSEVINIQLRPFNLNLLLILLRLFCLDYLVFVPKIFKLISASVGSPPLNMFSIKSRKFWSKNPGPGTYFTAQVLLAFWRCHKMVK